MSMTALVNLHLLIEIRHNILVQFLSNHIEVKKKSMICFRVLARILKVGAQNWPL